jgi:hypothetical protein
MNMKRDPPEQANSSLAKPAPPKALTYIIQWQTNAQFILRAMGGAPSRAARKKADVANCLTTRGRALRRNRASLLDKRVEFSRLAIARNLPVPLFHVEAVEPFAELRRFLG